jgi:hypothetical protein
MVIDTGETQMRQAEIGIPGTDGYSAMAWQRLDTPFIRVGWPLPNWNSFFRQVAEMVSISMPTTMRRSWSAEISQETIEEVR